MQLYRSWLFVPGNQQRMIDKALDLDLDAAILDLEDGVPPDEKEAARRLVREALARPRSAGEPARFVRVSATTTPAFAADIEAVISESSLDGIVLAKVVLADDVRAADAAIRERETSAGHAAGGIALVASIESALGLMNVREISQASDRVAALMFGAEDFSQDLALPLQREGEAAELLFARSSVVVAAVAAELQAIDQVWPDVRDLEGLRAEALTARRLGFTGKSCIHPDQLAVVHEAFRPAPAELDFARRVDEAYREAASEGHGATAVDGRLVDPPVVERARRLLDYEQAIEQRRRPSI
jgi:citrate lyase subunit beta/citryl-CoA lyase